MRSAQGRTRIAVGTALVAVAVVGNLVLYSSAAETRPVLQVVRDVPAGSVIGPDDVREVAVGVLDPSIQALDGSSLPTVLGWYAKTRIVSGSLLVEESLQSTPLMSDGGAVVALPLPAGEIPAGLRERSSVEIVLAPDRQLVERIEADIRAGLLAFDGDGDELLPPTVIVSGVVSSLPSSETSATGERSISIEVAHDDAHLIVVHPDPRLVLLPPSEAGNG